MQNVSATPNARHERGAAGMPAKHDDAYRRLRSMPMLGGTVSPNKLIRT